MEQKKEDTLDTLLNKLCDQLDKSICSDGKSNVVSNVKNCIAECFGILTFENEVLKKKLISVEKKIELLEKALKDNSNEAERSRVICGALNDLDSVRGSVSLKEEQRLKLQKELTTLQQLQKIGICNLKDEDDLELMIGEMYFDNLATDVERQCPMITEIVKLLVTGKRVQVLLALDDIRSQKTKSDFSTLFGLLSMSHGAGKTMLDALEPFGLCKSYNFL